MAVAFPRKVLVASPSAAVRPLQFFRRIKGSHSWLRGRRRRRPWSRLLICAAKLTFLAVAYASHVSASSNPYRARYWLRPHSFKPNLEKKSKGKLLAADSQAPCSMQPDDRTDIANARALWMSYTTTTTTERVMLPASVIFRVS